jgi:hypothetical protein
MAGPRSAVSFALGHVPAAALPELTAGTGADVVPDAPGGGSGDPGMERSGGESTNASGPAGAGVPMWRGVPEADESAREPSAPGASASGPSKNGPPPVWGAPLAIPARSTVRSGTHVIERDEMGPVIKWRPPEPSRPTPDARGG